MFDSYNVRAVTERVTQNVNVTEKRAPTDESVRLLREMEKKARDEVLKTIRLDESPIKAVLHIGHDVLDCETRFLIVYSLNGQRREVEYRHRDWKDEPDEIALGIRDALAKDVATQLTASMCNNISKYLRGIL